MSKVKKQDDGCIPDVVINQLIEHTVGGFVLFYLNAKTGSPEEVVTFDSPIHCLGLQKHISDWSKALSDLGIESEKRHILMACQPPEPEDTGVI